MGVEHPVSQAWAWVPNHAAELYEQRIKGLELTLEQIRDMPMAEYAKYRKDLLSGEPRLPEGYQLRLWPTLTQVRTA